MVLENRSSEQQPREMKLFSLERSLDWVFLGTTQVGGNFLCTYLQILTLGCRR